MQNSRGNLYIDSKGILRMVMENFPKNIVRGIDVSNMTIFGISISDELESIFNGYGNFDDKRNKVIFK